MPAKTQWDLTALLPEIDRLPEDWALIPVGSQKFPQYSEWEKSNYKAADFHAAASVGLFKGAWVPRRDSDPFELPEAYCRAVGVLCGEPSGGLLFLDHDGRSCDRLIEELAGVPPAQALPRTPVVRSGRQGRYQAIYRVPERYWSAISTRKLLTGPRDEKGLLTPVLGDEGKPEQLEFRWTGAQSVVLGHHPSTDGYSWVYHPANVPIVEAPLWAIEQMLEPEIEEAVVQLPIPQPSPCPPRTPAPGKKTWAQFSREFSLPWDGRVPLEAVLAKVTRSALLGQYSGGRNDTGILVARDMLGAAAILTTLGQRFDGDPERMFFDWCRSVGLDKDSPTGQPQKIWKSAERSNLPASLPLGAIENCIRAYAWGQLSDAEADKASAPPSELLPVAPSADHPARTPEELRNSIAEMLALEDPFAQAIAEAQVAARFHLAKQKILELAVHVNRGQRRPPVPMAELEVEFLEQAYSSDAAIDQSVDTGLASLDAYLQGLFPGDLFVIAGRPSMGKSALGVQICKSIAQRYRRSALIFSFEMDRLKIMNRLVAAETSIDSNRIQRVLYPHNSPEEERIDAARKMLASLPMHFDAMQRTTIDDIESISQELSRQTKIGVILVDHLGLIHGPPTEQRTQQMGDYTRRLKLLAGEMGCPVIVLSQLNRGVESRANKRPMSSDLRESGSVEQDADQILMVYRDEYYNPASPDRGIAELILTKNRDGATGTARTLFEPEFTRFRSLVV